MATGAGATVIVAGGEAAPTFTPSPGIRARNTAVPELPNFHANW